ncbi:hypothetical protein ACNFBT_10990 [Pseudomonas sp. NY15181]|uniref:hypothetical protein n=1 Tax=Pseudomonas sp. NY15181 TaxID=3400349 RepID=UPI003A868BBB
MSTVGQAAGAVIGATIGYVATGGNPYGAYLGAQISAEISGLNDPSPQELQPRAVAKQLSEEANEA